MIVSVLLPSVSQELAHRAITNLAETSRGLDYEVVLVSAYEYAAPRVIHVPETERRGCVRAYRRAYETARGDFVVPVPDDWLTGPGWLEACLDHLLRREGETPLYSCGVPSWNVYGMGCGTVYGIYYPFTPLMRRSVVEAVGGFYDGEFVGGWVDPDLALRVWRAGGRCEICPDSYTVPVSRRELFPEGQHKYAHFESDMALFRARWDADYGAGWGRELRDFNINVPPALLLEQGHFQNDPERFAALLQAYGVDPLGQKR